MIAVHRASARFVSEHGGIVSRHCFSAGAHYDPDNTAFGPLIAVDEHIVAPGSGFTRHAHRGVVIVSWVLDGVLRHEDGGGRIELVGPGTVQVQSTGSGIVHAETNPGAEPLRFIQTTLLADVDDPAYLLAPPPVDVGPARFAVHTSGELHTSDRTHLYVARGSFVLGDETLAEGDSVRVDEAVTVSGAGELLICTMADATTTEGS